MIHRYLRSPASVVTVILLCFASVSPAQEVMKSPENATVYTVCAGDCNRSMEIAGTFDTVELACQAVDDLRQKRPYVGVLTGHVTSPRVVHPSFRDLLRPDNCSVVRKSRRCGSWFVSQKKTDLKSAEDTVEKIRKDGQSAEVVYHLPKDS